MVLNKEPASEELSPGVSQMDLENLNVKKEEEEPPNETMESCATSISSTAGSCQCEEDEDKVLLSQFDPHQSTDRDLPISSCPDHMKAESGGKNCGGAESSSNPDLNPYEDDSSSSEMENKNDQDGTSCDCQLKPFSDSESVTEDSEKEWNESKSSESDVKAVNKSLICPECGKPVLHKWSLQKPVKFLRPSATSSSSCWGSKKGVGVKQAVDSCVRAQLKSFSCDDCGFSFSDESKHNSHMRIHTEHKPFMCDICGQRFSHKSNLISHIRVHTGQKPFSCELCEQRFSQKTHLNRHMSVHTEQKPFVCELCEKRFSRQSSVIRHMIVHTGQKPFDCKVCGQKFIYKAHLNRHTSVHTGQKPFACDVCGKGFSQKTNLKTHMRVHTGLKPFVCDVCGDRFSHKSQVTGAVACREAQTSFSPATWASSSGGIPRHSLAR
ncbi:zinc finger protein OZF isoform X1 [Nothobranchius furzeri]|uniref:zinc finger protein OZF isoform X1 n=1 Tax=Nothobranchius furzeri TaxID=105023 RepID=UPI002403FDB9|nr:zinc finger protein OZF [Nothobranchius furzeri]